jgi:hypothetical protein
MVFLVISDTCDMFDHSPGSLHVRGALENIIFGKLPVAIPASSRYLFAIAEHICSFIARFGRVVAVVRAEGIFDNVKISARYIGVNQHDVVTLSIVHHLG